MKLNGFNKLSLIALALSTSVTGCFGFGEEEKVETLNGERISINLSAQRNSLQQETTTKVQLDDAIKGTWAQVNSSASNLVGHFYLPQKVRKVWDYNLGGGADDEGAILNSPVVSDGKVFAVSNNGTLHAINLKNGRRVWKTDLKLQEEELEKFSGGVAVDSGVVFVTSGNGEVKAYSAEDGLPQWTVNVASPLRSAPTVSQNIVFVLGADNRLFALNSNNGSIKWVHSTISEDLTLLGGAAPAVAGDMVVVPYSSGEVYALGTKDGRYLWHDALSINVGSDPFSSLVDVDASPVIDQGLVYAANHNGQLTVFDAKTGRRYWSRPITVTQTPAISGNTLFVITEDHQLVAIQRVSGKVMWSLDLVSILPEIEDDEAVYFSGPVLAGNRLFVVAANGYAMAISPTSGKFIRGTDLGENISVAPIVADNTLIFLTDDAEIISFQ